MRTEVQQLVDNAEMVPLIGMLVRMGAHVDEVHL
jgi:hypothetical protein